MSIEQQCRSWVISYLAIQRQGRPMSVLPQERPRMVRRSECRQVPIASVAATQKNGFFTVSDEPHYGIHLPVEEPSTASEVAIL